MKIDFLDTISLVSFVFVMNKVDDSTARDADLMEISMQP